MIARERASMKIVDHGRCALRPGRHHQHVEQLVKALPELVAMLSLPADIQPVRADPRLPGTSRGTLRGA
jgi:hypothetical protein